MAKKTPKNREDGVAVNFRITDPENISILTLVALAQRDAGSRKLSKAGLAKQGLLAAAKALETTYRKSLPPDYVPLKA